MTQISVGVAVHQQLAIHRAMLEASGNINLTAAGDRILATCTVCHGERTFEQPVCLWDVLDMMGHHYRRNHR